LLAAGRLCIRFFHKMAERTQIQLKAATHIFSRNSCIYRARKARL
jgi:hypothetical protein